VNNNPLIYVDIEGLRYGSPYMRPGGVQYGGRLPPINMSRTKWGDLLDAMGNMDVPIPTSGQLPKLGSSGEPYCFYDCRNEENFCRLPPENGKKAPRSLYANSIHDRGKDNIKCYLVCYPHSIGNP
jgi:hypothetical protein